MDFALVLLRLQEDEGEAAVVDAMDRYQILDPFDDDRVVAVGFAQGEGIDLPHSADRVQDLEEAALLDAEQAELTGFGEAGAFRGEGPCKRWRGCG